ncbi:uncharacterized protein [Ptychodera flava]
MKIGMVRPYPKTMCCCICLLLYCTHTSWYIQCSNHEDDRNGKDNTCETGGPCSEKGVVLLIGTEWTSNKSNLEVVVNNRELAKAIAQRGFKVYCTVLNIQDEDISLAAKENVDLVVPTSDDMSSSASRQQVILNPEKYYPSLKELDHVQFVVSHAFINGTARMALRIRDKLFRKAKLITIFYYIPEDEDLPPSRLQAHQEEMESWAAKADLVLSLGPNIFNYFTNKFRIFEDINHHLLLPFMTTDKFDQSVFKNRNISTFVEILTFHSDMLIREDKFHQFDLPARIIGDTCRNRSCETKLRWKILGVNDDVYVTFRDHLNQIVKNADVKINFYPPHSLGKIYDDLIQCHIVLYTGENSFGLPALLAASAGVPLITSENTGFSSFLKEHNFVYFTHSMLSNNRDLPTDRIKNVIQEYDEMLKVARNIQTFLQKCAVDGPIARSQDIFYAWLEDNY